MVSRLRTACRATLILATVSLASRASGATAAEFTRPASSYPASFFQDQFLAGEDALRFWHDHYSWRAGGKLWMVERLNHDDPAVVAAANREVIAACRSALQDVAKARSKGHRVFHQWVDWITFARNRLTPEALAVLEEALRAVDLIDPGTGLVGWLDHPGGNGSNVHGYLTPLALGAEFLRDARVRAIAYWGFRRELDHMNSTGDMAEFNLLESHWNEGIGWEVMKRHLQDPTMRRMARMIGERLWLNRALTWSTALERNTGPGSRMAPSEWLGCDNDRIYFATGLKRPIWINPYFEWDGWDSKSYRNSPAWLRAEAMRPDLPDYFEPLVWQKQPRSELQCMVDQKHWTPYPKLATAPMPDPQRPVKYVNYQTESYALGSSTSSWIVNTCYVGAVAWWNNSRNPSAPLGSPARYCVLYPHYVFNGMSMLDQGDIYYANQPDKPLTDNKGGPRGPWLREFVEFGRLGTVQHRNTLVATYTPKPATHRTELVKSKVQRASAAMFLMRWTDGLEGLYVNREPIAKLPRELQPGDWWFIEDGETFAAVRPLEATRLRGGRTVLEARTRHIVLYQDNFAGADITGISDEAWVQARSGFVVEMGDRKEHGSFEKFREIMLAAKVSDRAEGFERHVAYARADRRLEMQWNSYTEAYAQRRIDGKDDPWVRFVQSPEFSTGDAGRLEVRDATLQSLPGKPAWLLSAPGAETWVAYQPEPEQNLPLTLRCPAGTFRCERFPFGKLVVKRTADGTVSIEVDAEYRPSFLPSDRAAILQAKGQLPAVIEIEAEARTIQASINGLRIPVTSRSGQVGAIRTINPYTDPAALRAHTAGETSGRSRR